MAKKLKPLETYLLKAINNIESDRADANALLIDIIVYLKTNPHSHEKLGVVAAKYLETLQRSNEQLVKISELLRKSSALDENVEFSDSEIEDVYEILQEETNQEAGSKTEDLKETE